MDSPKVTVVIPCYKQAHWLPDAITSVLNQTVKCDIIVVNDGSPDNTSEVAKQYDVKLIEKENGGLSSARNRGIQEANTEWILTLDADDKIDPSFIEKCLNKAEETGADIIATGQQEFGDSHSTHYFQDNPTFEMFMSSNRINCCSLFRKKMWEDIGGYEEEMKNGYEDWFFWLKATKKCYNISVISKPLFFYRKHGRSMVNEATEKHAEIVAYMHKKIYEDS